MNHVKCLETGDVYESVAHAVRETKVSNLYRAIYMGWSAMGRHYIMTSEPATVKDKMPRRVKKNNIMIGEPHHLCPDCAVPINGCAWWHTFPPRAPKEAITAIRKIREYEQGQGSKRVKVDRKIVVECPNYRRVKNGKH